VPEQLDNLDRRSHLRTSVGCDITLNPKTMPAMQVTAMNLSASGVYCVSSRSLGELTRVDLMLRLYSGEEIPARAVVIREEELSDGSYGLGLFFTRIAEESRETIMDYTSQNRMEC
jgi:c-di-GMP-binding flagellar brake protein YcgR